MKALLLNLIYHKLGGMIAPAAGAAVAALCLFMQAHWHITFDAATQTEIALGIGGAMTTVLNLAVSWYKNGKMVALQQSMGIVAADGGKPDGMLGPITEAVASYVAVPVVAPVAAIQAIPPEARAELFRH